MKIKKQNEGISLIVLVLTIIIMIILAGAVIISLSNNGIIGKANQAVSDTNLKQVQIIAQTIWGASYLDGDDPITIKNKIIAAIGGEDVASKYIIEVNENGVTVEIKGIDKSKPEITLADTLSSDSSNPTSIETATFMLTGKVVDESGIKSIIVNGTEATLQADGSWNCNITLSSNETTTITIVATDNNGNTTTDIRYVIYRILEAGLYQTGTRTMIMSWDELISNGILNNNGIIVSGKEANLAGDIVLPSTMRGVYQQAFKNCSNLTGVTIPEGAINIGAYAFDNCSGLTSIRIPSSVKSMEYYVFRECTNLTTVTFGENSQLEEIGVHAFDNCTSLNNIEIPEKVENIYSYAFYYCIGLTSIKIPSNVIEIGENAFYRCENLATVTFDENSRLTTVGGSAFSKCKVLKSIEIPHGVTSIGNLAFNGCTELVSLTLPSTITDIKSQIIYACGNLTRINYDGTTAQWTGGDITFDNSWNVMSGEYTVYCTDGTVSKGGVITLN